MDAHGKLGEHEGSVLVALGEAGANAGKKSGAPSGNRTHDSPIS